MKNFDIGPLPDSMDATILEQLALAEVATIGHWRRWGFVDRLIARLQPGPTIVGTAVTVAVPSEDNSILHHALSIIRPGDILIVDRLGDTNVACYGGTINHAAKLRGAAAVIIDGPCTDVREIRESGLPVWCRGSSGRTSRSRGFAGRLNVPISVGGAVVMPGDALLCDDDGVLVLPPCDVAEEASRAIAHQDRVSGFIPLLNEGQSLPDLNGASEKVLAGGISQ